MNAAEDNARGIAAVVEDELEELLRALDRLAFKDLDGTVVGLAKVS